MKKILCIVILLIIILCLALSGCTQQFSICFLGDSITEQYPIVNYFNEFKFSNKGIYDELSSSTLLRTPDVLRDTTPDILVLLIGTNDLSRNVSHDIIVSNIVNIVNISIDKYNVKHVFIQSVYPLDHNLRPSNYYYSNTAIKLLNSKISIAIKDIKSATYIDVYSALVNSEDNLTAAYSSDGLHISKKGYSVISKILNSEIRTVIQ